MPDFTHFDQDGQARMVDVASKSATQRTAIASGVVRFKPATLQLVREQQISKGDVLGVARIAAIQATKRTAELIPLCHPLKLDAVDVAFSFPNDTTIRIEAKVSATERTGVEMEALMAVSVAALTLYDMCKSSDKEIAISEIRLESKTGGKSGPFSRTMGQS